MDGSRFRNLSRKESDSAHAHVSTPVFHMDIDTTNQAKKRTNYWRRMLGSETLGKGFTERCPRQRPLGEFLDGEGVFAEGPLSGTRQRKEAVRRRRRWRFLCRGPTLGKEMVFFNLFAEGRPSKK